MPRNLDLTALRSFVAVAESGGVTRAAGQLHLTQSAVSMQLKRLEESLGQSLLDRSGRTIALTAQGDLLLSYARRLLALNDEVWSRLTDQVFEGEVNFGVPHDIVYPHVPYILKRFAAAYPRVKVNMTSSHTTLLKDQFYAGDVDVILTTEVDVPTGAEELEALDLVWYGAPGGSVWKEAPLRIAFGRYCLFRPICQKALDDAGIAWESAVETDSELTIDATLGADLAVHARLRNTSPSFAEEINHNGALPELPRFHINLYAAAEAQNPLATALAHEVRQAYARSMDAPRRVAAE
ncbi:MAG: LysR family transcriptional regulator [Pseudomonadota bacterium]